MPPAGKPMAWMAPAALAVAVAALAVAVAALSREPRCPSCATPAPAPVAAAPPTPAAPPAIASPAVAAPAVVPAPVPEAVVPAVPPAPVPDRAARLARYRGMVDTLGRLVVHLAATYPASLPAHAPTRRGVVWPGMVFGVTPSTLDKALAEARALVDGEPAIPEVDDAGRRFVGHVEAWLGPWTNQLRYLERGDYLDDDLAAGRKADPDLRASLATAVTLWRALADAIDAPWRAEVAALAARAPGSDRAILDRAWEACRGAATLVLDRDALDRTALGAGVTACRDGTEALRARHLQPAWGAYLVDSLDRLLGYLTEFRRDGDGDRAQLTFYVVHASEAFAKLRDDLSTAQAEAIP